MSRTKTDALSSAAVLDLGDLRYTDTYTYDVKHPATDKPLGWLITFASPAHPQNIAALEAEWREQQDAALKRQEEVAAANKRGEELPPKRLSMSEMRADTAKRICRRVVEVAPAVISGRTIDDVASLEAALIDPGFSWLAPQLDRAAGNAGMALPAAPNTAPNSAGISSDTPSTASD